MKTKIIILTSYLTLQFASLFAANITTFTNGNAASSDCEICILAPVTPAVANFEETTTTVLLLNALAPVTPSEADFSDVVPEKNIDLSILAPVAPSFADFTDDDTIDATVLATLTPSTPAEADFE